MPKSTSFEYPSPIRAKIWGMIKHITSLTGADEDDGFRPIFLHVFYLLSTLDMGYSSIYIDYTFVFIYDCSKNESLDIKYPTA